MLDLISVIVPVYNVEKYLRRCIDSILNQTYQNLEIILIDDGSTDNSGAICDEYIKKDNRILVIHQENKGLAGARNSGLDIAKGKYIGCVDSDDYIHPEMYERLYNLIVSTNTDMAVCGYHPIYSSDYKLYPMGDADIEIHTNTEAMEKLYEPFCQIYWVEAWNKLYSRWIFDKIRYPEGINFEDNYIYHRILETVKTIVYTHERLLYYYQREDSIMRENYSLKKLDELKSYEDRAKFFEQKGYDYLKEKAYIAWLERLTSHYEKLYSLENTDKYRKSIKIQVKEILTQQQWLKKYKKLYFKFKLFLLFPKLYFWLRYQVNRK